MTVLIDYTKGFFETTEGDTVGTNPATIGDVNFADVELLLHMGGSNGSTTFTDSSSNGLTVTANGNAQISTTQSKFGGSSAYFDGNGDYLTASHASNFNFGSGDFTAEVWFNVPAGAPSGIEPFITTAAGQGVTGTDFQGIWFGLYQGQYYFLASTNQSSWDVVIAAGTPPTDTWTHFCVVRSGNTFTLYVNGVSIGTTTSSGTLTNSNNLIAIGGRTRNNQYSIGYLDDVRVTKGVARYTSNFTAPTAAFLDVGPTLDLSTGSVFTHTPSANVAYTFTNPPASGTSSSFTLKVTPSATVTVTWPSSVVWSGGIAPTAPANGETDVYSFYTDDGGTTYYGFVSGDALA
jgi:hypothetical protein